MKFLGRENKIDCLISEGMLKIEKYTYTFIYILVCVCEKKKYMCVYVKRKWKNTVKVSQRNNLM